MANPLGGAQLSGDTGGFLQKLGRLGDSDCLKNVIRITNNINNHKNIIIMILLILLKSYNNLNNYLIYMKYYKLYIRMISTTISMRIMTSMIIVITIMIS